MKGNMLKCSKACAEGPVPTQLCPAACARGPVPTQLGPAACGRRPVPVQVGASSGFHGLSSVAILLVFVVPLVFSSLALGKVRVVSTIPDFAAIAREIGGGAVEVAAMVRPTQDPHYLDAKPSYVLALNKADLVLLAGMELEAGWLPPLLVASRNSRIQKGGQGYLDCSTFIVPMEIQAPDRAGGDIHPGGNPHYWNDPRNGILIAQGIALKLASIDPEQAETYQKGLDRFTAKTRARMEEWTKRLQPFKGTKVVVYHKSWTYFMDFAGFIVVGTLEPKPGIPPSPSHVAELLKMMKDSDVKFVLQESFYPTDLSRQFALKSGAQLKVLPTMVGAAGTKSYLGVIDSIVNAITE